MNLTLFPVAAILLLLSGMGAPAHVAGQGETSAALMRALFGSWDEVHTEVLSSTLLTTHTGRQTATRANHCAQALSSGDRSWIEVGQAKRVSAALGIFERKQYRTRFGFADGAYLAVGPPAPGLRTRLDPQRSQLF